MKYVTTVDKYLSYYFEDYVKVEEMVFINENNMDYLLWSELIDYLDKNKEDNPDLYALLGDLYYKGIYFDSNYNKAKELYDRGISLNSLFCMCKKADLLIYSVDLEYEEASILLKMASDKGFAPAINNLGWMYSRGLVDGKIDDDKAFEYYKKAAELGSVKAMANCGRYLLQNGFVEEGIDMLIQSANKGNTLACMTLGKTYYHSSYVEQNYEQAYKWFKKAAMNENAHAFKFLGDMYLFGYYVKKDIDIAKICYKLAINLGNGYAKVLLARLINEE